MQIAAPSHHAFVCQFWLKPLMNQAPHTSRVIAFETKNCAFSILKAVSASRTKAIRICPSKSTVLPSASIGSILSNHFESHGPLPGSSWLMAATKGGHDLCRRHADRIEANNRDGRVLLFNRLRYRCFAGTGGTGQDDQGHDLPPSRSANFAKCAKRTLASAILSQTATAPASLRATGKSAFR